jgi:hypothetical protein
LNGTFEEDLGIPNPWNDLDSEDYDKFAGKRSAEFQFMVFCGVFTVMITSVTRTIITPAGSIPDEKEWDMVSEVSEGEFGGPDGPGKKAEPIIRPPSNIDSDMKPQVGRPVIGAPLTTEGIQEGQMNNARSARSHKEEIEEEAKGGSGTRPASPGKRPAVNAFERKKYGGVR